MENEKWKTDNGKRKSVYADDSALQFSDTVCAACGAKIKRETAKYCLVCGKFLDEGFQPLDNLRASYNLQGKSFNSAANEAEEPIMDLFEQNKNDVSQTAWACLVYSMVPYLGILFVPLTFCAGGFGYAKAVRQPRLGGRRLALLSFGLSFVVLGFQIFLWWLLYIIPELGKAR